MNESMVMSSLQNFSMLKQVSAAMLCLLVLASCSPKTPELRIDGSSKEAYEKSVILIASGLTNEERMALSAAIDIVRSNQVVFRQFNTETNNRAQLSGKTRDDLIDEARKMVLDWFESNKNDERLYYELQSELIGKVTGRVDSVQTDKNYRCNVTFSVQNSSKRDIKLIYLYFNELTQVYPDGTINTISAGTTRRFKSTDHVSFFKGKLSTQNMMINMPPALDEQYGR